MTSRRIAEGSAFGVNNRPGVRTGALAQGLSEVPGLGRLVSFGAALGELRAP